MLIHIETGNDAFADGRKDGEIVRILRDLADTLESGRLPKRLVDANGNTCGTVKGN